MKIYKQEILDGLKDKIAQSSIALELPLQLVETDDKKSCIQRSLASLKTIATNVNQQDLFYLKTILVSTGCNNNDDIFLPEEIWASKNTAEDKPFNLGHTPNKVIGHITGNWAVDENYLPLEDDLTIDDLPEKFHILTSSVIYRHLASCDSDLEEEIAELIEEIKEGKWFVSMECLFPAFDYGLMASDGSLKEIIPRNKTTAYYTKHLRIYGGSGEYEGQKVGRVLRDIIFSGKGLVKKPANPDSIIFNSFSNLGVYKNRQNITMEKIMAEDKDLTKENATLLQQIASLELKLKEVDVAGYKTQIETLNTTLASKDTAITDLTKQVTDLSAVKADLDKQLEKITATVKEQTETLNKMQADTLKMARITTLVDKGIDKSQAEALVEKFISLGDEQFAGIVEMQAELVAAKKMDEEKKKTECETKTKAESEDTTKAEEILDTAKADDVNLNVDNTSADEGLKSALASYFGDLLGQTNDK